MDEYIKQNRDRYTREAIERQLREAGHDQAEIDAAWERAVGPGGMSRGWRPGWWTFAILVAVGAIGAGVAWAGETYGGGGLAVVVYVIIVTVAYGIAKGIAMLVDSGRPLIAGVILAIIAAGGLLLSIGAALSIIALAVAVLAGAPAILLIARPSNRGMTGAIAAAIPLVVWLAITGTCLAPLYGRLAP